MVTMCQDVLCVLHALLGWVAAYDPSHATSFHQCVALVGRWVQVGNLSGGLFASHRVVAEDRVCGYRTGTQG